MNNHSKLTMEQAEEMKDGKIVEHSFANAIELDAWVEKKEAGK